MPKLLIFDAFTLLIPEKTVASYAFLRCKTFSLKIWVCKIFDKFHVWASPRHIFSFSQVSSLSPCNRTHKKTNLQKQCVARDMGGAMSWRPRWGLGAVSGGAIASVVGASRWLSEENSGKVVNKLYIFKGL